MARKKMVTSRDMCKMRVFGGKRRTKRIGKVKSCVFHPSEKRCVGFMVKRPDLLWMFHRKDLFVALDGFDLIDGRIVVKDEGDMTGPAACRRMGIDWDRCVIWEGMPLMTIDGTAIGCVGNISFSLRSGEIESVEASNGTTAKYLLGTLEVPADYIKGFKRGMGVDLVVKEDSREAGEQEQFKGAIVVSDDVWELSPEGGWAESAGEFTAKARARMHEAAEKAKPKVQEVTHAAGEAINEGAYAVGPAGCRKQGDGSHPSRKNTKKPVSERSPESSLRARPMIPRKTRKGTLSSIATLTALNSMLKTCRSTMFSTKDDEQPKAKKKPAQASKGSSVSACLPHSKRNTTRHDMTIRTFDEQRRPEDWCSWAKNDQE